SLSIRTQFSNQKKGILDIAVIHLPFISNYSDLEPFLFEEDVSLRWVNHASEFGQPDAIIIPGTKSTISDLQNLREKQLDILVETHVANGGYVVGICGGYQILGEDMVDEHGSDTGIPNFTIKGLGIIPSTTFFYNEKETNRVIAQYHIATGLPTKQPLEGYEIHLGKTTFSKEVCPFLTFANGEDDGYFGNDGQIIGTYLHHLFHNDVWRNQWLNMIRKKKGLPTADIQSISKDKDKRFDFIAAEMKSHLKWDLIKKLIDQWGSTS
ncbi:MAG: cobyric acid synthase CobQ, partial [Bacillus sp. (in: firmicutes)]